MLLTDAEKIIKNAIFNAKNLFEIFILWCLIMKNYKIKKNVNIVMINVQS